MKQYDHKKIERKWQKKWAEDKLYETPDEKSGAENFYVLVEYPYPSGDLHLGHWYAFSPPDIFARKKRMEGYNVLFPIGFDSFGLPAENAAIKRGLNPKEWTYGNIARMTEQLKSTGNSFDWSRTVTASDPEYYGWTQWLFLQLFKNELAYKKEAAVNWCPSCKTVLANEQIMSERCERCDTEVIEKNLEQWFLKITDYAERLLTDLEELDWPKEIKEAERNWIGRSEGAEISFQLVASASRNHAERTQKNAEKFLRDSASSLRSSATLTSVKVFTTRPDTLYGATYLVLSPEHSLIANCKSQIANLDEVEAYLEAAKRKKKNERTEEKDPSTGSGQEKTGVEVKGIKAINPATKEEIPVWVADYVLGEVGTGAIMAVPAHDQRDFAFAEKHDLPVRQVITAQVFNKKNPPRDGKENTERVVVHAILRNPKDDTVLLGFLKDGSWGDQKPVNFIIGGVLGGETFEEAGRREILEETGYTDIRFVGEVPFEAEALFFQAQKDVNRRVHVHTLLFELASDRREPVDSEEEAKHEFRWLPASEVAAHLNIPTDELLWRYVESGGFAYEGSGTMINSGDYTGLPSEEAKKKITKFVGGEKGVTYRLRDWLVSRQRYWGTPIPIVYDPRGIPRAIPEKHLPWLLPEDVDFTPTGEAPLARSEELKKRTENIFGAGWRPEVDTMDTFVDSSWYFLRYLDPSNDQEFCAKEKQEKWMPVDHYSGGAEHTTMHLLYSRFFYKALADCGLVTEKEPYKKRMNRGLILGPDGHKMSKSRGNVIDPDLNVERFGADSVRLYLAFVGPYNEVGSYPWDVGGLVGVRRFLERVWRLQGKVISHQASGTGKEIEKLLHKTIKKVSEDIEEMKFNTAISALMILANEMETLDGISPIYYAYFIQLLAPFAPHITEELWQSVGEKGSVHEAGWPKYNEALLYEEIKTIVVQIDGKVRDSFSVSTEASEDEVKKRALEQETVKRWIEGKKVKKVIYVKGRLVSIVTGK